MRVFMMAISMTLAVSAGIIAMAHATMFDPSTPLIDMLHILVSLTTMFLMLSFVLEEVIRYIKEGNYYEKK